MATKKPTLTWQGHPVRDEEHLRDLDLKAAVYQFHHGMDRNAAEHRVKHEDRVERHQKSAAHHLDGMKAAYAVGNHEAAQQHHAMYSLHLKALGLDPSGAVPTDVARWQGDKEKKHAYTFKGHPDDQFLVEHVRDAPPLAAQAAQQQAQPQPQQMTKAEPPKSGHWLNDAIADHNDKVERGAADPCPNCGKQQHPIEKLNDYCSGCAQELKDAIAYRNEDPFPESDEEFEGRLNTLVGGLQGQQPGSPAHQRLLDYLRKVGVDVQGVVDTHPAAPQTPAKPPLRVFGGGGKGSAPKYGHLRVVKHEDWPHIIGCWMNLAKADGATAAQGKVRQFDVNRTWLRHKHMPEEQAFDYSSWLTPEQHQNGYRMFVLSHGAGNPVRVHVTHNQRKAGTAVGNVDQGDLEVENYNIHHSSHHHRGIEAAMLNALMGHAKSKMGANYLSHGPFTPEASAFISAIAKPHGFQLGEPEDIDEGETPADQRPGTLTGPGVKVRSTNPKRAPRSFQPRVPQWWRTGAEEND